MKKHSKLVFDRAAVTKGHLDWVEVFHRSTSWYFVDFGQWSQPYCQKNLFPGIVPSDDDVQEEVQWWSGENKGQRCFLCNYSIRDPWRQRRCWLPRYCTCTTYCGTRGPHWCDLVFRNQETGRGEQCHFFWCSEIWELFTRRDKYNIRYLFIHTLFGLAEINQNQDPANPTECECEVPSSRACRVM